MGEGNKPKDRPLNKMKQKKGPRDVSIYMSINQRQEEGGEGNFGRTQAHLRSPSNHHGASARACQKEM